MRSRNLLGALIGLLSAAVAVCVGELVAAFVRPAAAPIIAVGNRVITLTPEWIKRIAIRNVGTDDKTLLLSGIYLLLAVFALVVGRLAVHRLEWGLAGLAVFGGFGCYCALTANGSRGSDVVPTILATLVAAAVLTALVLAVRREDRTSAGRPSLLQRRAFLQAGAAGVGLAAVSALTGRSVQNARFDRTVAASRKKIVLPTPASPAPALPRGTDLGRTSVPWQTPSGDFYRIDTALSVPQVAAESWSLRIHGMVDREIRLDYDELLARPMIERWVTLCCVSNEVGGDLIGNAKWLGARFADLLREAGVHADCDQLLLTSVDGYTFGAPTKVVMDGRDAMLAVGMNGSPLPAKHGFPVRVVVPGLYGYVSACKWVVDVEATTFAAAQGYWVQGGWAAQTDIKLESRIDTPRSGAKVTAGTAVPIAGIAWDQHVGIAKVEVQVDDGDWLPARLATVPSTDTWRQWVVAWTPPKSGTYTVRVRATDASGTPQTETRADVYPSGATGLHTITVHAA